LISSQQEVMLILRLRNTKKSCSLELMKVLSSVIDVRKGIEMKYIESLARKTGADIHEEMLGLEMEEREADFEQVKRTFEKEKVQLKKAIALGEVEVAVGDMRITDLVILYKKLTSVDGTLGIIKEMQGKFFAELKGQPSSGK